MNILSSKKHFKKAYQKSMYFPGENHWVNIIIELAKSSFGFTTSSQGLFPFIGYNRV